MSKTADLYAEYQDKRAIASEAEGAEEAARLALVGHVSSLVDQAVNGLTGEVRARALHVIRERANELAIQGDP